MFGGFNIGHVFRIRTLKEQLKAFTVIVMLPFQIPFPSPSLAIISTRLKLKYERTGDFFVYSYMPGVLLKVRVIA